MNTERFSQYEFEHAIYQTIAYGTESEVARILGVSPGLVSQYFNPSDERESVLFKAAAMIATLIEIDPEAGCNTLQTFNAFARRAIPGDSSLSVDATRRKAKQELMESDLAEVEGKSLEEQIKEHEEAIVALTELVAAKKGSVREFASKAVGMRNGRAA